MWQVAVLWCYVEGVSTVNVAARLVGSCRRVGGVAGHWSSGLGSPGFCSEMSLPDL